MKNEFEVSRNQKATAVNELEIYIKKLINEELNNRNLNSNTNDNSSNDNNIKVENDMRIIDSDNSSSNANYLKVINEMKELKINQQELINNVAVIFNLKEEIYQDFERIKKIFGLFQNQFHEMRKKIQECQTKNSVIEKVTEKSLTVENSAIGSLNDAVVKDINNKLETMKSDINILKSKNEKLDRAFKSSDKQIEERLYEKIRVKQKEISEGFNNQDKKITAMDDHFRHKLKELDEKSNKCIEQCNSVNRKVHELSETISKIKIKDSSEEIKKLSNEIKENKMKEDERITNVTNILNVKINKVDTQVEFLNKQIDEYKKDNQKLDTNFKTIQNKYKDVEKIINDVSNIALNVNDNYEKLTKQNESTLMNISILETTVNSLENNFRNYDLEKMKNNINILKTDVNNFIHNQFKKFKDDNNKIFIEYDTKLLSKIGDVYKSINGYSQKFDVVNNRVEEKFKLMDVISDDVEEKLRSLNSLSRRFEEKMKSMNNNSSGIKNSDDNSNTNQNFMKNLEKLEVSQNNYWNSFNEKFQKFVKQVNDKHNYLSSEIKSIKRETEQNSCKYYIFNNNKIGHNINII